MIFNGGSDKPLFHPENVEGTVEWYAKENSTLRAEVERLKREMFTEADMREAFLEGQTECGCETMVRHTFDEWLKARKDIDNADDSNS